MEEAYFAKQTVFHKVSSDVFEAEESESSISFLKFSSSILSQIIILHIDTDANTADAYINITQRQMVLILVLLHPYIGITAQKF